MGGISIWHLVIIMGIVAVPSVIVLVVILSQKPKS